MHAVATRTTSMLTSAALLTALAIAGLTMSISFTPPTPLEGAAPVTVMRDDLPAPPPPLVHPRTLPPPLNAPQIDSTLPDDTAPLDISSTDPSTWAPPSPVPTILNPHWVHRPSNLQSYYPRRALQRSVEGVVQLDCRVTTAGTLQCAIISETPAGWDLGVAALRIARDHQMTPAMRDGVPVEGRYQMRVPFRLH